MIRQCVVCGKEFETCTRTKTCSPDCHLKHKRLVRNRLIKKYRQTDYKPVAKKKSVASAVCSICGKTFKPNFFNEKFYSDKCRFSSLLYRVLARLYSSMGVIP